MNPNPTVWDGKFFRFMPRAAAIIAQAAGLVQIFEGPLGYVPGFSMKYPNEFPFVEPEPEPAPPDDDL